MHLNSQAVKALSELCQSSKATIKKKLGPDLAKVFDDPVVAQCVVASKMKQGPLNLTEEQKAVLPPWLLSIVLTIGPILFKMILERLGIKLPS